MVFLLIQSVAVLAITPVYLSGVIAEEKERGTLLLLFGSHLTDREIVLGKLFARLAHLGSVFLTGFPILLLVGLFGSSRNLALLLPSFVITGITLLSAASISMLCSVLCRNSMNALMASYGLLLVFNLLWIVPRCGFVTSPIAFVVVMEDELHESSQSQTWAGPFPLPTAMPPRSVAPLTTEGLLISLGMTVTYVLLHGFISVLCLVLAIAPPLPNLIRSSAQRFGQAPIGSLIFGLRHQKSAGGESR